MGRAARLDDSAGLAPRENSCLLVKLMKQSVLLTCLSLVMVLWPYVAGLGLPSDACLKCPCEPCVFGSWGADVPVLGCRSTTLSLLLGAKGASDVKSRDVSDHLAKVRIRRLFCSCLLPSFYLVGLGVYFALMGTCPKSVLGRGI